MVPGRGWGVQMVLRGRWVWRTRRGSPSSAVHWSSSVIHSKPSCPAQFLDQLGPLVAEPSPEARVPQGSLPCRAGFHSRTQHDDTHQHPEEEKDGEEVRAPSGVVATGAAAAQDAGGRATEADACREADGTLPQPLPFPAQARSILLGPTACCLVNISKPAQSPPMPHYGRIPISDVTPFNFQTQGRGQADQSGKEAGSPKDTQPASNRTQIQTWIYPQGLLWLGRERAEVTLFISDEAEWGKSRRPSLSLVSHVTSHSLPTLSNLRFLFHKMEIRGYLVLT